LLELGFKFFKSQINDGDAIFSYEIEQLMTIDPDDSAALPWDIRYSRRSSIKKASLTFASISLRRCLMAVSGNSMRTCDCLGIHIPPPSSLREGIITRRYRLVMGKVKAVRRAQAYTRDSLCKGVNVAEAPHAWMRRISMAKLNSL
jgi:hypothetical protein